VRILILHDDVPPGARPDEADTLVQSRAVAEALRELGHSTGAAAVSLSLDAVVNLLERDRPDLVFNLVESLAGRGALIHLVPTVLDSLAVPYTGCPARAVHATSNKLIAKRAMRDAAIPTPDWIERDGEAPPIEGRRWIVKSVWEHASLGLDEDSVIEAPSAEALRDAIASRRASLAGEGFAEAFIDGREFNLSLLEQNGAPTVLPPAEILFENYAEGRPRVVGYRAKWDPESDAFHHTPRRFDFPPEDRTLLETIAALARSCWFLFQLRGYARVDFRVDDSGMPWVLEVNTNPCIAPDAGFIAAAERAGLTMRDIVRSIVESSGVR